MFLDNWIFKITTLGFLLDPQSNQYEDGKNILDPFLMGGNKDREVIIGLDQYHLCLFLITYPEKHLDEIATFIANAGDGVIFPNPRLANE